MRLKARKLFRMVVGVGVVFALSACGTAKPGGMSGPSMNNRVNADDQNPLQSNDILAREADANETKVKHILIGWGDLADSYPGDMDPRAQDRSAREAEELVKQIYDRAVAGEPFEALMLEYSEDSGSKGGDSIDVYPAAGLVLEFKQLGLRLEVGEIGVVQSSFGWHIMKRVS